MSAGIPQQTNGSPQNVVVRNHFNMSMKTERGGCRFVVAQTDEGKPVIQLQLFHDSVPKLNSVSIGFEVLSGISVQQARMLVDAMNKKIVGIIVGSK